jgi:hypothetical protein
MGVGKNRVCPVERAGSLDNRFRRLLQNPRKILGPYIEEGMTVLDLGCGPGFFSIEIAQMVGKSGRGHDLWGQTCLLHIGMGSHWGRTLTLDMGFVCVVHTRPRAKPFMRFLFVISHVCHRASFRPLLAEKPLPSARIPKAFGISIHSYEHLSVLVQRTFTP